MRLIRRTILCTLPLLLATGWSFASEVPPGSRVPYAVNPYAGMFGSMGNVYSPYYRQFHQSGMSGMAATGAVTVPPPAPQVPYLVNPNAGMFGSMGNVYSPYYRQLSLPPLPAAVPRLPA